MWQAYVGLAIVAITLLVAVFAPWLTSVDPDYLGPFGVDSVLQSTPQGLQVLAAHTAPLGSPESWSRLLYGARFTLLVCTIIGASRLILGVVGGFLAAEGGRIWRQITARAYLFTTIFPALLITVVCWVVCSGLIDPLRLPINTKELMKAGCMVLILGILEAPRVMIVIEGRLEQLKQEPFYEGAVAVGYTSWGITRRHLLPHLIPTLAQQFANEFARSLVSIATLGALGIYVLGTRVNSVDAGQWGVSQIYSGLVPDWGGMIAEQLYRFRLAPLETIVPATAVTLLILGVSLLGDGLEAISASMRRPIHVLRERTGRWGWVLAVVATAAAILVFYQGWPWGRATQVARVLQSEVTALEAGDREAFLAPIASEAYYFRQEQSALFDRLQQQQARVSARVEFVQVRGASASATVEMKAGLADGTSVSLTRKARLIRRWGIWYDEGHDLYEFRARLAELHVAYPALDATDKGTAERREVQGFAALMDRLLSEMAVQYPSLLDEGPLHITAFSTPAELAASLGMTEQELGQNSVWYRAGESVRVCLTCLGENPQMEAAAIRLKLLQAVVARQQPDVTPILLFGNESLTIPALTGRVQQTSAWMGAPLLRLRDLLYLQLDDLEGPNIGWLRALQCVELAKWLREQLPAGTDLTRFAGQPPAVARQSLAAAMQMSEAELERRYWEHIQAYIRSLALWSNPQARQQWLADLVAEAPGLVQQTAGVGEDGFDLLKMEIQDDRHAQVFALVSWPVPQVHAWAVEKVDGNWRVVRRTSDAAGDSLAGLLLPHQEAEPYVPPRPEQIKLVSVTDDRFSIKVPEGWTKRSAGPTAVFFQPTLGSGSLWIETTRLRQGVPQTVEEWQRLGLDLPMDQVTPVEVPGTVTTFSAHGTYRIGRSDEDIFSWAYVAYGRSYQQVVKFIMPADLADGWEPLIQEIFASYKPLKLD